jgi:protocatechuate 3,4-dioxygenase beta subunit
MGKMRRAAALAGVVASIGLGLVGAGSPAFAAGNSTVTPAAVTVTPDTAGSNASYTIPFTVASALVTGNTIDLTGPSGTYFTGCASASSCQGLYSIAVSGGGSAAIAAVAYPSNSGSAENAIVVTLGASEIAAGETVTVSTESSTTNPARAGTYTMTESTSSDPTAATSPAYTIAPSLPAAINIASGNGQSAEVSTKFALPLVASVTDSYGNPVPGAAVTFHPVAGDAGANGNADGTFASCPADTGSTAAGDCVADTDSSGQATSSTLTADAQTGGFAVTATVATATGTASTTFSETIIAVPPTSVTPGTVTASPGTAGSASTYTVTLTTDAALPVGGSVTLLAPNGTTFTSSCSAVAISPCSDPTVTYKGGPGNDAYSATDSAATGPGANSASSTNNEITITLGSSLAGSSAIPAGTELTITLTGATNPQIANQAYTVDEYDSVDSALAPSTSYAIVPGPAATLKIVAGNNQSAQVVNQIGRLEVVASDRYGNTELAGSPVTFVLPASAPSGTFPGGAATQNDATNGSGDAYSSVITADTKAGSWTAVAEIPNPGSSPISPVDFSLTNLPANPAVISVVSGSGQSPTVGAAFASPVVVSVADQYANPVPGVSVTFSSPSAADATFGGSDCTSTTAKVTSCATTTNGNGQAAAGDLSAGTQAGAYNLTASAGAISTAVAETNAAGPPARIVVVSGNQQDAAVNTAFPEPLAVQVQDTYGNPVGGAPVQFAAPSSGASGAFASCAGTTPSYQCDETSDAATGDASSSALTANATPGAFTVTVSDPSSASVTPATFSLDTLSAVPARVVAGPARPTTSATVGTQFGTFQVTLEDANGAVIPGANVTFSVPSGLGTFANGTTSDTETTDSSGVATSSVYTAGDEAYGSYPLTAAPTGATSPSATFTLTNLAGTPARLIVTPNSGGTPQSAVVGQPYTHALSAEVLDKYGNGVGAVTVTFTAPSSGPSGAFGSGCNAGSTATACAVTTAADGIATAPTYTAGHTAGPQGVSAAAGNLTPVGYSLTNTAGPAASLEVTSGSGQTATVGSGFAQPVAVTVVDQYGNPVTGATVEFAAPPATAAGGVFGSSTSAYSTSDSYGVATSPAFAANHVAGSWNLAAQIVTCQTGGCNVGTAQNAAEVNRPDSVHLGSMKSIGGNGQARQVGQTFAQPMQVEVLDQYGNAVPNMIVDFAMPSSAATGSFAGGHPSAEVHTNNSGIATSPAFSANLITGSWRAQSETRNPDGNQVGVQMLESNTEGYWLAGSDGSVQDFGDAADHGSAAGAVGPPTVGIAGLPDGNGYYLVDSAGKVSAFDAPFYGDMSRYKLPAPIVGIAVVPGGNGYYLVGAAGAVFAFGPGAAYRGSEGGRGLSGFVGMAVAPNGAGYWLVNNQGAIYSFGVTYYGGEGGKGLTNVVGMAADPNGGGYWLVSSGGGIFSFGAPFYGSEGGKGLTSIVGMMAAPSGQGYWLVGHGGGVFSFGPQGVFEGSGAGSGEPVIGGAEG